MPQQGRLPNRPQRSRWHSARYLIERRLVGVVFVTALICRVIALMAVILVIPDSWIALDDSTYSLLAEQVPSGDTGSWPPSFHVLFDSVATFLVPLTFLYWVFGPVDLLGQVLVALVGAGAAALTTKLALQSLETRWAMGAGMVVALLPSQIVLSVALLKDAWVWSVAAALALAIAVAFRTQTRVLLLSVLSVPALLFLLGHLRLQSTFVAASALVATALFTPKRQKSLWVGGALIVALVIPWLAGGGPGGIDPVLARGRNFAETRADGAADSDSAIVDTSRIRSDLAHLPQGLSVCSSSPTRGMPTATAVWFLPRSRCCFGIQFSYWLSSGSSRFGATVECCGSLCSTESVCSSGMRCRRGT